MPKKKTPAPRPNIDTQWFLELRKKHEMSMRQLAKRMERDPASLSRMLNGLQRISMDDAAKIAGIFNADVREVMRAAGIQTPSTEEWGTVRTVIQCLMAYSTEYAHALAQHGNMGQAAEIHNELSKAYSVLGRIIGGDTPARP